MATVTDLYDIPTNVPELAHLNGTYLGAKFAVYYIAPMSDADLETLMAVMNTSVGGYDGGLDDNDEEVPAAAVAARADFAGKSLRDVIDHHVTTAIDPGANTVDPLYDPVSLIVVMESDWRTHGVLLMSLDFHGDDDALPSHIPRQRPRPS